MSNVIPIIVQRMSNGDAFTTSLLVAEKFEKRHDHVLRKIEKLSSKTFTHLKIGVSEYQDESGRKNKMYLLNRDAFSFIAMGFTGTRAEEWKLKYIDAFNQMERHLRNVMKEGWLERRTEAALEYRAMSRTLQEVRKLEGKTTAPHHYANEAKLVNWAMVDEFTKIDRNSLNQNELRILTELETYNAVLIGAKFPRDKRKVMLRARFYELDQHLVGVNQEHAA